MGSASIFVGFKTQPFRNLARVVKPDVAWIVPNSFDEFRALRQWMIPYVISTSDKLTERYYKTGGQILPIHPRNCSASAMTLNLFELTESGLDGYPIRYPSLIYRFGFSG